MRALSRRQAQRCEDATMPRCKCRCGGAKHGKKRGEVDEAGVLVPDDPHFPRAEMERQLRLEVR